MTTRPRSGRSRTLRHFLFLRGLATGAVALVALRWPDPALSPALRVVGVLFVLFGAADAALGFWWHRRYADAWLLLANGGASIAFGALTLGTPAVSLHYAVGIAIGWLVAYGALVLLVWNALLREHVLAPAVLVWGLVNLILAIGAGAYSWPNLPTLLYVGAGYAVAVSFVQVAAALWLGHWPRVLPGQVPEGRTDNASLGRSTRS